MRGLNLESQLPALLLGFLSLIPNHAVRYSLLVITACITLLYVVHLKHPSTQLGELEDTIKETEEIIQHAKSYCARDVLHLAEKEVQFLQVKRSTSMIKSRVLEMNLNTLTWKKYRVFSRDINECAKIVENIQNVVQAIVEAERQHKLTQDINEAETVLTNIRSAGSEASPFASLTLICTSNPTSSSYRQVTAISLCCI
ncbi:hypothetical protein C8R44DRAFT_867085 [Mycena epipterygia]|nr:hypothetical protein C8R44DRAFT_867085 [Mycena epipterygia]